MKKITICTPVYEMKSGLGKKFLVEFLSHLLYQSMQDFEVVISDQSNTDVFKNICDSFSNNLCINYIKNTSNINNAANNVNNAIKYAKGEIIKLLYVDDFFVDPYALEKIYNTLKNSDKKWLINGFTHCNQDKNRFFDTRIPWFGNKYVNGDNTTGNPSTYAVKKDYALEMDENLLWIVDGEYFYRSYYHYGDPLIIEDTLVAFREHEDSAFLDPKLRELELKERKYCVEKYEKLNKI